MAKPTLIVDMSKMGVDHQVFLDDEDGPVIVEVISRQDVTLVLVRDDLRVSQWRRLRDWAHKTFDEV